MKQYAMILKKDYVRKSLDSKLAKAIIRYESKLDPEDMVDETHTKVLYGTWTRSGEDHTNHTKALAELNSGEYRRAYVFYNSKYESNYSRENAYPKEDEYAPKNLKERCADEYHVRDNRIQTPEKFGDTAQYLHWLVSQTDPEMVDIVHIDLSEDEPTAYSVTKEFYAPVPHFKNVSPRTEAWSQALGYTREETIAFLMWTSHWTEEERVAYANGTTVNKLGTTPDTQITICGDCGLPTVVAPACIGSINESGKFVPVFEDSKQMTCQHCGADLSTNFDIDYTIPAERFVLKEQDSDDEEVNDIFESIAALQTEIDVADFDITDININYIRQAPTELVKKNAVPNHHKAGKGKAKAIAALNRAENAELEEMLKKKATSKRSRIQPLSAEAEERAARILAQVKNKTTACKDIRTAPSDTIEEIRARQQK